MIKEIYINGSLMDTDDKTIIGFDLQSYDVKDPANPKIIISNTVTFPCTSNNLRIIGFADNPQVESDVPFYYMYLTYNQNNEVIVEDARVRITEVGDRISMVIYQKNNVWDSFKVIKFPDIEAKLFAYLVVKYGYPIANTKVSSYGTFLDFFINSESGITLPFYFGNLYDKETEEGSNQYLEGTDSGNYITLADGLNQGGHFSVYALDFFQFLEDEYGIDFQTNEDFQANIFKDEYASKVYFPLQSITAISDNGYYISLNQQETYEPLDDVAIKTDKSIYDFILAYFQHFNVIMDNFWNNGNYVNRCYRFDQLSDDAPVVNWSGKISGKPKYYPILSGFAQSNSIKFSEIYDGGAETFNSRTIFCANKNIDAESELFTIECYMPKGVTIGSVFVPLMNEAPAFNTFTFLIYSGNTKQVTVYLNHDNVSVNLKVPALYSLDNEYRLLEAIAYKPKIYEVEKWFTLNDIRNLRFFAQYYIEELGGTFFLNKVKGYVAGSLRSTTKCELIKIGSKTPIEIPGGDFFVDGNGNIFTDGNGNLFY